MAKGCLRKRLLLGRQKKTLVLTVLEQLSWSRRW